MQKELFSLSIVKLAPGTIELGMNRSANQVMLLLIFCLSIGGFASLKLKGLSLVGCALFASSLLVELNRRWMNRIHLMIEGNHVRFRSLRTRHAIEYSDPDIQVDIYRFPHNEGGGLHHSARLIFSDSRMPDILIQESLLFFKSEQHELEAATNYATLLRSSLKR